MRYALSFGLVVAFASVLARPAAATGCTFCDSMSAQQSQLLQLQQLSLQQPQQGYKTIGSPRPFGTEKRTRAQEFNRTGVLHPEYLTPATLRPDNVSQFYYLSPRAGPLTFLVSPCNGPISWTVSYVEPPNNTDGTEATKSKRWPVKSLKPGLPLFSYEGAEDKNCTISNTRAGLYWIEIKSLNPPDANLQNSTPSTVLLYATNGLEHVQELHANGKENRRRALRFQQRRNKRRLTISWDKSNIDPDPSQYCLAVTSGSQPHPLTLCAAQNVLHIHPHSMKSSSIPKEQQRRSIPEGLHCVCQTKLTLSRMKYNTTYNFTLYVVNTRNNVSNRIATDTIKFRRTPELKLRAGHYVTANLRKTDGFVKYRYRPAGNSSTTFHILPCGDGVFTVKLNGPGIIKEKEVAGYTLLKAPPLTSGKTYTLRISVTPQELVRVSAIKVLATQESSTAYPQIPSQSAPREYRSLRTCNEVTIGIESAGTAKYCILRRELKSNSLSARMTSIPDQCHLRRRRRSEHSFMVCEEKQNPPKDQPLPLTLKRLQPGRAYILEITAQSENRSLSYPLLTVRTRRSCLLP